MARKEELSEEEIILKIMEKKEFSKLLRKDVEMAYSSFDKKEFSQDEKIKKTRDLLRKMYTVFVSEKLLNLKEKDPSWFLKKHMSTRERYPFYKKLYSNIFNFCDNDNLTIFDFGCGVNGFSYPYFPKKVKYIGVEAVGQLVEAMNFYFKKNNFNAKAIQESLFEIKKIKDLISKDKSKKIIFLFKVLDSLEMLKRDFSKSLLQELTPKANLVVVSFATESLISRKKFYANRNWIINFIINNFELKADFSFGGERYLCFSSR